MPNSDEPLERVRFHQGQMLTAQDLQDEQDYFLEKARRHNRLLHGSGVVCGLEVKTEGRKVLVQPGSAIDGTGRLIEHTGETQIDIPRDRKQGFVGVEYAEEEVAPDRIREGAKIVLLEEDPCRDHARHGCSRWVACGEDHPVPLARFVERGAGLRLDRCRPPRPGFLGRLLMRLCCPCRRST
jgi:hypothetical protein